MADITNFDYLVSTLTDDTITKALLWYSKQPDINVYISIAEVIARYNYAIKNHNNTYS